MNLLPKIELIEAQHTFPGPFTFKFIGTTANDFVGRVIAAVRDELELSVDPPYSHKSTSRGNHVSVTVTPHVSSAHQVLAIYNRVSLVEGILVSL